MKLASVAYIDAQAWEATDEDLRRANKAKHANLFARIWLYLRNVPRRAKRSMNKMFNKILDPITRSILGMAFRLFGWFVGWMFWYASIIIAFSYGLLPGMACILFWCILVAMIVTAYEKAATNY